MENLVKLEKGLDQNKVNKNERIAELRHFLLLGSFPRCQDPRIGHELPKTHLDGLRKGNSSILLMADKRGRQKLKNLLPKK